MKLRGVFIALIFIFLFMFLSNFVSSLRINEIEANPLGADPGNEWVELYSNQQVDLDGLYLQNYNGAKIVNLTGSFSGYFVYNFSGQWLRNENESLYLYNETNLIDQKISFDDSKNNDLTWNYCDGNWIFVNSTKGFENLCSSDSQSPPDENSSNSNNNQNNSSETENSTNVISQPLDYDYYSIHSKNYSQNTTLNTISLNAQTIKTEKNSALSNKIKSYSVYYIITFAVLLLLLFLLKQKKKDKNEFD